MTWDLPYNLKPYKVYKAISDSLQNHKIRNHIVLSIILNHQICIIKLWDGFYVYLKTSTHL